MQKRTFAVRITNVVGDYAFALPARDAVEACCLALHAFERRLPGALDGHRMIQFGLIDKEEAAAIFPCVNLDGSFEEGMLIERDFGRPRTSLKLAA